MVGAGEIVIVMSRDEALATAAALQAAVRLARRHDLAPAIHLARLCDDIAGLLARNGMDLTKPEAA